MNLQQLHSFPKDRVRALFGLEPAALGQLLAAALPELAARRHQEQQAKPGRRRSPGGGRRRKLYPYQEVLLTLLYLRHNVSHAVCGAMFGVSADISENRFHEVVRLLRDLCPAYRFDAEKKWTKREPSWHPDTLDVLLVDSFETPIARPSLHADCPAQSAGRPAQAVFGQEEAPPPQDADRHRQEGRGACHRARSSRPAARQDAV